MESGVEESGFEKLPILFPHAEAAGALPAYQRDPFDRMLIAQAIIENLTLVSNDRRMERYDVPILWA
jgi:PIN domain nuclease of toxin-antitoxin system